MQRFYIPSFEKQETFIIEDKDIFYQLVKVLRIIEWKKIIFFDWKTQKDYIYEIVEINKKTIKTKLLEEVEKNTELNFDLNLFQALPNKLEKIEYILQKWVEVWFKKFVFYRSERSQKLVISDKKEERLKKIIVEAVEQSGRNFVPELQILSKNLDKKNIEWKSLFLHTKNNNSQNLKDFIDSLSIEGFSSLKKIEENINLFIWPEWWFSESEIKNFEEKKFARIYLWNRILRTETAWIVVGFTLWQML